MCDVFTSSSATLAYIVVVFILTCPKIFCTSVIGVPLCRRCVARVCRNRCGVNGLSSSARSPINRMILSIASFFNTLWVFLSLTKRYSESSFLDARYCPKRSLLRAFRYPLILPFFHVYYDATRRINFQYFYNPIVYRFFNAFQYQ